MQTNKDQYQKITPYLTETRTYINFRKAGDILLQTFSSKTKQNVFEWFQNVNSLWEYWTEMD